MRLCPAQIESRPLTVLWASELYLLADTIRLAYENALAECKADDFLQEQIAALYVVAYYGHPAQGEDIEALARHICGIRLNLDMIDLMSLN